MKLVSLFFFIITSPIFFSLEHNHYFKLFNNENNPQKKKTENQRTRKKAKLIPPSVLHHQIPLLPIALPARLATTKDSQNKLENFISLLTCHLDGQPTQGKTNER